MYQFLKEDIPRKVFPFKVSINFVLCTNVGTEIAIYYNSLIIESKYFKNQKSGP